MIYVNSVNVQPKSILLKAGNWSHAAYAEVSPSNADSKEVQWHSENPSVASVNASTGYICGNTVGTTKIYATATDGSGCSDYLTVTVGNIVSVTSVTSNFSELALEKGQSACLSVTVSPDNATNKNLHWTSSDIDVATVNDGIVTGVSKGLAKITATATDGSGQSTSCNISVTEDALVTSVTVSSTNKTLTVGDSTFLTATVSPVYATTKNVSWRSSNTDVVTVNELTGLAIAHQAGDAIIYATACDYSGAVGTYSVRVNDPIKVECIGVDPTSLVMNVGDMAKLSAEAYPTEAQNRTIRWTSANTNIAEVDSVTGCVTAKASGSTNIYANAQDGSGVRGHCVILVDTVPGLRTIKVCNVRKEMSMDDSAILRENGTRVTLAVGTTVPLLSTSTIYANGSVWYRILYNGMMLHVTADDNSFEQIRVSAPSIPEGRDIFANPGLAPNIDIRSTPFEISGNIIGQFAHGTNLTLTCNTPQNSEWFAVYGQTTNGTYSYGWCSGRYLAYYFLNTIRDCYVRTSMVISPSTILKDSSGKSVVLRGDTVDSVRLWKLDKLTGGNYSDYNGNIRNDWYMVEYNGQIAYVTADSFYVLGFGEPLIDESQDDENTNNTISQKEKIYAATVYAEAAGQNYRTKQAVAHVMNNRIGTRSAWTDIEAVVSAPYQFEGYGNTMYSEAINYYNSGTCNNTIKKASMDECMEVIRPIYSGQSSDITGGALYFHSFPNASDWEYHDDYTLVPVSGTEGFWFYK